MPLSPGHRDAKARQHVRGQLAPFHRSALELRLQVRQKLRGDINSEDMCSSRWSIGESKIFACPSLVQKWHTKITPNLAASMRRHIPPEVTSDKNGVKPATGSPLKALPPLSPPSSPTAEAGPGSFFSRSTSRPSTSHHPTKRSHKRVTQLLQSRPPSVFNRSDGDGDPILDRIHDYYVSAGDTMAYDIQLLKSPPRRLSQMIYEAAPAN